jgi:hypothetical protein
MLNRPLTRLKNDGRRKPLSALSGLANDDARDGGAELPGVDNAGVVTPESMGDSMGELD